MPDKQKYIMTKRQIEKFAVGWPYPTDDVEAVLKYCDYNTEEANEILRDTQETMKIVQEEYKNHSLDQAIEKYNKLSKACNVVFPQNQNYKQTAEWLAQLKEYQQLLQKYKRRKLKYEKQLVEMTDDQNLSSHGFWDKGYLQGKIAICDELIDILKNITN